LQLTIHLVDFIAKVTPFHTYLIDLTHFHLFGTIDVFVSILQNPRSIIFIFLKTR
jgi:hypothetical protein